MPNRNPMTLALRAPQYRMKRTPTKTEGLPKLERKHRGAALRLPAPAKARDRKGQS